MYFAMLRSGLLAGKCPFVLQNFCNKNGWSKLSSLHYSNLSSKRNARRQPIPALAAFAANPPVAENSDQASEAYTSLKSLGVDDRLLGPLLQLGISQPTDVQRAAIPEILTGANVAVQSYTGSGKTLSYLLPVMSLAVTRAEEEWGQVTRKTAGSAGTVQAVVVAPSRELAMQIMRVAQSLLPESAKRAVQQCIGGANILRQKEALKLYKPFMVVGTPGRIAELSRDGALQTHKCRMLILDEADQLLAPQFREEMTRINDHCGRKCAAGRQTLLVSATLTPKVLLHCQPWCPDPRKVFVGTAASGLVAAADHTAELHTEAATNVQEVRRGADGGAASRSRDDGAEGAVNGSGGVEGMGAEAKPSWGWGRPGATSVSPAVDFPSSTGSAGGFATGDVRHSMPPHLSHFYVPCPPQHKVDSLRRAIHAMGAERALVFMNFQQRLKDVEAKLAARSMPVGSLHGELTKQERQKILQAFRDGALRALIVSDVAARGLDIPECDAVFHLELPTDPAHYAHRAGRTGRAGRPGTVVSLISGGERYVLDKLGRKLGVPIKEMKVSHGKVAEANGGLVDDAPQPRLEAKQRQKKK